MYGAIYDIRKQREYNRLTQVIENSINYTSSVCIFSQNKSYPRKFPDISWYSSALHYSDSEGDKLPGPKFPCIVFSEWLENERHPPSFIIDGGFSIGG